jgi:hypothetical protein
LNPIQTGVLDTTLRDKVCQQLAASQWFSPGTPVSFTNKTDRHHIAEVVLKVKLCREPYKNISSKVNLQRVLKGQWF